MNRSHLHDCRQKPQTLIENRIGFAGPNSELSIYDTYQACSRIGLDSEEVTFCGMITGKKVVHSQSSKIEFLPQQSFVMSPGQHIDIDFPLASEQSPTTCMTINLSRTHIQQVCDRLNVQTQQEKAIPHWQYLPNDHLHENLSVSTQLLLERLTTIFSEDIADKNVLIEFGVSELIVRMLRQQTRNLLLEQISVDPDQSGLHSVLNFIESNLQNPLDIDHLSKMACMSRSKFFKQFKLAVGFTPAEYQIRQRIRRAAELLKSGKSVTESAVDNGFINLSHFGRR
ncbi:MAG: AraC family transcriptional regulator, partial [Kangiellaceae bacterium]|nr:AraC family transcriptional regulator [Kangiellaceae bacterium]